MYSPSQGQTQGSAPTREYPLSSAECYRQIEGDLKHYQGTWRLEGSSGGNETVVVCCVETDPGLPLPGWVLKRAMAKQLSENLQALMKRAESGMAEAVPEEKGELKGQKEKIVEIVRRGRTLEIWFMGKCYRCHQV